MWNVDGARLLGLVLSLAALTGCELPTEPRLEVASVTLAAVGDSATLEVRGEPRGRIAWESLSPGVVTVSESGVARAVAPGVGVVRARSGDRRAEGTVVVLPGVDVRVSDVREIPVSGGTPGLSVRLTNEGGRGFYRLELWRRDPAGTVRRVMTWVSDAEALPGMNVVHRIEGLSQRVDWVVVRSREPLLAEPSRTSCSAREGAADCPVDLPGDVVAVVLVKPGAAVLEVGEIVQYSATAYDPEGRELHGWPVVWSTPSPSVISLGPGGRVRALAPGYGEVRATVRGVPGAVGLTVTRPSASSSSFSFTMPSGGMDS